VTVGSVGQNEGLDEPSGPGLHYNTSQNIGVTGYQGLAVESAQLITFWNSRNVGCCSWVLFLVRPEARSWAESSQTDGSLTALARRLVKPKSGRQAASSLLLHWTFLSL
jgi:hypothetical protein